MRLSEFLPGTKTIQQVLDDDGVPVGTVGRVDEMYETRRTGFIMDHASAFYLFLPAGSRGSPGLASRPWRAAEVGLAEGGESMTADEAARALVNYWQTSRTPCCVTHYAVCQHGTDLFSVLDKQSGIISVVPAKTQDEAIMKVWDGRMQVNCVQNGNNGTSIRNVGTLTLKM